MPVRCQMETSSSRRRSRVWSRAPKGSSISTLGLVGEVAGDRHPPAPCRPTARAGSGWRSRPGPPARGRCRRAGRGSARPRPPLASRASSTLARAVRHGSSVYRWKTTLRSRPGPVTGRPSTVMVPDVGWVTGDPGPAPSTSRSRWSDQAEQLPGADLQVQRVEGHELPQAAVVVTAGPGTSGRRSTARFVSSSCPSSGLGVELVGVDVARPTSSGSTSPRDASQSSQIEMSLSEITPPLLDTPVLPGQFFSTASTSSPYP